MKTGNALQTLVTLCPFASIRLFLVHQTYQGKTWDEACNDNDYLCLCALLQATMQRYPRNSWVLCLHARSLWHIEAYERAAMVLENALSYQENYDLTLFLLGRTYMKMHDYLHAQYYLDKAIAVTPLSAKCYYNRALTYEQLAYRYLHKYRLYLTLALLDMEKVDVLSSSPEAIITQKKTYFLHLLQQDKS